MTTTINDGKCETTVVSFYPRLSPSVAHRRDKADDASSGGDLFDLTTHCSLNCTVDLSNDTAVAEIIEKEPDESPRGRLIPLPRPLLPVFLFVCPRCLIAFDP